MALPDEPQGEENGPPTPFSFKLTVALLVVYLAYRLAQLVACVPTWFTGGDCPYV